MSIMKLSPDVVRQLEEIYQQMETSYGQVAAEIGFSCNGCPDNCCDSYFQHHTYLEWCFLLEGIERLDGLKQKEVLQRAHSYVIATEASARLGERPQEMCPLNEEGLCIVYHHRMMVCRTHGVPATITRPDNNQLSFPGCFRCQEKTASNRSIPRVDRTPMLMKLAALENKFLLGKRHILPKVKLTIAEMLVKGAPDL